MSARAGVPEVSTGSPHPGHADLYKTLVLLKIAEVYFVIEGLGVASNDDLQERERYFYDEHTCPTNYIKGVEAIVMDGSFDPHGCFDFVRAIWMPQRYADAQVADESRQSNIDGEPLKEMLAELFPELVDPNYRHDTIEGEIVVHQLPGAREDER